VQTELLVLQPICCTIRAERLGSNLALATRVEDSTLADILPLLPLALGTCGAIPIMGTLVARLAHKGGSSAGANSAPIGQALCLYDSARHELVGSSHLPLRPIPNGAVTTRHFKVGLKPPMKC